jgi:hypothetical protein
LRLLWGWGRLKPEGMIVTSACEYEMRETRLRRRNDARRSVMMDKSVNLASDLDLKIRQGQNSWELSGNVW